MEDEELNLYDGCDYCELRNTGCRWCTEAVERDRKLLESEEK